MAPPKWQHVEFQGALSYRLKFVLWLANTLSCDMAES